MAVEYFVSIIEKPLRDVEIFLLQDKRNADFYDILNYKLHRLSLEWNKLMHHGDEMFRNNTDYKELKKSLRDRYDNVKSQGYEKLDKANYTTPKDFERVLFNKCEDDGREHDVEYQTVMKKYMLSTIKGTIQEVQQYLKAEKDAGYYSMLKYKAMRFQEIPRNIKDLKNADIYKNPVSDGDRKKLWNSYMKVDRNMQMVMAQGKVVLPRRFGRVSVVKRFEPY